MSWLLLDAGNSALKWALVPAALAHWPDARDGTDAAAGLSSQRGTMAMDAPELATALAAELARACTLSAALGGPAAPSMVIGCAVTSQDRVAAIGAAIRSAGAGAMHWLHATERYSHEGIVLRSSYRDPTQLGADRWHALIGARARFPRAALALINAGTATTVDGVQADGMFCGGVIVPGVELMRSSLARGTARLPLASGDYVLHPDNTDDAIRTGILDAQLGLIERRIRRIREMAGASPQVIISGGSGAVLAALLQSQGGYGTVVHEPDLVLRGLWHQGRARAAAAIAQPL
jgi:type III pantothenate kinase